MVLQPVFRAEPVRAPEAPEAGPHRLRAEDADGQSLWEVEFQATPVADLPEGSEEHFSFLLAVPVEDLRPLHRVAVEAGTGLTTERLAGMTASELQEALAPRDAVQARAREDGRVQVQWDGDRLPWAMIRDPDSRRVVGFADGGDARIATDLDRLTVVLSEGVRSGAVTVPVQGR